MYDFAQNYRITHRVETIWILTFICLPRSYFSFSTKIVSLKVAYFLKMNQHTRFRGTALTGEGFVSTSEVSTSAFLWWLKIRDWKAFRCDNLQWHDLPAEFHKKSPNLSNVIGGYRRTNRYGHFIYLTFVFKGSRLKTKDVWYVS
jgi:hypothetical protein